MKILIIADVSIATIDGGAERVLIEQSRRLAMRGHLIHILTRRLPRHAKKRQCYQDVTEWRYDCCYDNPAALTWSILKNAKRLFDRLYQTYHYDCLYFHQPISALGVLISPHSKSVVKFYTCHSLSFEEFKSRNAKPHDPLKGGFYLLNLIGRKLIEKHALKSCDRIIVLSRYTQEKLKNTYHLNPKKISVIRGGVDLERFKPADNKLQLLQRQDIPGDKVVVLTVRNLVQRMGLENLIISLKFVTKEAANIYLIIGGEGPLRNELEALVKRLGLEEYIYLAGYIPEDQLQEFYQLADLFVLPTKELEGFGLVTLEALASGLPVLGTPVGGTREILSQLNSQYLFSDTSPDSMADLILKNYHMITKHTQRWQEVRRTCRRFAEKHYSWEQNVDALESLFFKFAGPPKTSELAAAYPLEY